MKSLVTRLAREPLVHFLLLGALVFWVNARLSGPSLQRDDVVQVGTGEIERLRQTFMMQWRRPPTERELTGLIDAYVRETVLYREALALGLDRDDTIVRRRLAQKMEFLSEDVARVTEPAPGELGQFFEVNAERYREPVRVSFSHVYFSIDRRGAQAEEGARAVLRELRSASPPPERAPERGDRFMLQFDYPLRSEREIGELFGSSFGAEVIELPAGEWQGPIASGYGLHLVRVGERAEARMPALSEVRLRVENDWRMQQREAANQDFYARLRNKYRVEIDQEALAAALGDRLAERAP